MCDANIPTTCKQRFKGVENFLRRVAFNLGNSASQTEVKIISCIPIDVTDLQQKIISLEKELHDAKECKGSKVKCQPNPCCKAGKSTGVFNTSVVETSASECCTASNTKDIRNNQASCCTDSVSNQRPSNISFVYSSLSVAQHKEDPKCPGRCKTNKERKSSDKGKSIFRRRKKKGSKEDNRQNTQFVYYAEATHSPFKDMHPAYIPNATIPIIKRDNFGDHLSRVMRKQYDPKVGIEEFTDTSEFSRPICRDLTNPLRYDSDICSCCHGRFQNIDDYMGRGFNFLVDSGQSNAFHYTNNNKTYYDSDFYDIVPVKETSGKLKYDLSCKDETKKYIDVNCWPETIRTKHRVNPVAFSYRAEIPPRYRYYKQTPMKPQNLNPFMPTPNRHKIVKGNRTVYEDSSIECGVVYTKPIIPARVTKMRNHSLPHENKNNTVQINTDENQIKKCKSIQLGVNLLNDTNTGMMLEQIKTILQSVLTEVKTNTLVNKEEKPKKDAIVQKGSSQNNMAGCSTLLHSFTYNTSHDASSYFSPYSPHTTPSPLCYASIPYQPAKCMQNLQYLLHPCHRHQANSFQYQNNNAHLNHHKPVNIAINTDTRPFNTTSKETRNLIKDIYKSVALNMGYSTKASSKSEYDNLKSFDNVSTDKSHVKSEMISESEVTRIDEEIEAYLSSGVGSPLHTTLQYAETSAQSEDKSETKETTTRDIRKNKQKMTAKPQAFNLYRVENRNRPQSRGYGEPDESKASSSEESDTTVIENTEDRKVRQKKGLLQRFFRSVKMLKRRKPSRKSEDEEDEEQSEVTDTDDNETTYTESVNQSRGRSSTPARPAYVKKAAPINIQVNGKRIGRSPYMEQEERRQWNEMFHEKQKFPSARAGPSRSMKTQRQYTPYRRNYDVRSVVIDDRSDEQNEILDHECHDRRFNKNNVGKEHMNFLKKHKLGLNCRCGERFKNLILEN